MTMDTESNAGDKYQQLKSMLAIEDIDSTASEVHGVMCARACLGDEFLASATWLSLITGEATAPGTNQYFMEKLDEFVMQVRQTLTGGDYDLELLLGDDDAVDKQTEALGSWCQGFVLGILGAGEIELHGLPEAAREIVRDFMEISGATVEKNADEDDARALVELVEYVRVGVQVVFEDLNDHPVVNETVH